MKLEINNEFLTLYINDIIAIMSLEFTAYALAQPTNETTLLQPPPERVLIELFQLGFNATDNSTNPKICLFDFNEKDEPRLAENLCPALLQGPRKPGSSISVISCRLPSRFTPSRFAEKEKPDVYNPQQLNHMKLDFLLGYWKEIAQVLKEGYGIEVDKNNKPQIHAPIVYKDRKVMELVLQTTSRVDLRIAE